MKQSPAPARAPSDPSSGKRVHDGFFIQLSLGPIYLDERWTPSAGGPEATYRGWGTSLETSVGRSIRPGIIIGGGWQCAVVIDPNESYLGTVTAADKTARLLDVIGAFVEYYPHPGRGFHFGGTVGVLVATNVDLAYGTEKTSWGPAISLHVGDEIFFSKRWSVGALTGVSLYHYSTSEAGVSSVSDGLVPMLAIAFTFN